MAVNDVWQVSFVCGTPTQLSFNVRHYRTSFQVGGPVGTLAVATRFATLFNAAYKALLSSSANFLGVVAQKIRPLPMTVALSNNTGAGVGEATGDLLPKQVAGIITIKTALAGRRFRGRLYVPFPAEVDSTVAAAPTGSYITRLGTLAFALLANVVVTDMTFSETMNPIVFSRKFELFTPVVDFVAKGVWATQRRRGDFGRLNPPILPG